MKMSGFEIFLRFERYNIGCEMEEKIVKTKILIVDDEHGIVDMIQSYFQKQYDILTAYSGQEALQKIASNPDLILLDINMPDMDGFTVCQRIREHVSCPILFLTARVETGDKIKGFTSGADDYIVKPFDTKEVIARIKAVYRRVGQSSGEAEIKEVKYDKLSVNMTRYELRVNGQVLDTPPKELELLFHLASNPNRVYTRDQLLDEVWGFEYYGDSRTIDVHVKRLREKLEGVLTSGHLKLYGA